MLIVSSPKPTGAIRRCFLAAGLIPFWSLPAPLFAQEPESPAESRSPFGWPADPIDEPLVTDRPDFTESTDAVPRGRIQIEMGYTFTYDREHSDRSRTHTAPELLTRFGLFDNFEFRFGWEGYSWNEFKYDFETPAERTVSKEEWEQGAYDVSLGFKYKFFEQDGLRPHFGVIVETTIPSGSDLFGSSDVEPGVVALWAYDVTDRFAIAGNVGVFGPVEDDDRYAQATGSISFAYSLTERIGSYVEYFGIYPNTKDSDCAHSLNGGLTYLITDNFQVDWRAGFGLNEEADDFFTGVGFGWRF